MVQALLKTVLQMIKQITYDPVGPLLGMYQEV